MQALATPLPERHKRPRCDDVAGAALLVNGCIPVALSNSEGAGSVQAVV